MFCLFYVIRWWERYVGGSSRASYYVNVLVPRGHEHMALRKCPAGLYVCVIYFCLIMRVWYRLQPRLQINLPWCAVSVDRVHCSFAINIYFTLIKFKQAPINYNQLIELTFWHVAIVYYLRTITQVRDFIQFHYNI